MSDPVDLPIGPERRQLMEEHGLNITLDDFTPEEQAEIQDKADAALTAFAEMTAEEDTSS